MRRIICSVCGRLVEQRPARNLGVTAVEIFHFGNRLGWNSSPWNGTDKWWDDMLERWHGRHPEWAFGLPSVQPEVDALKRVLKLCRRY